MTEARALPQPLTVERDGDTVVVRIPMTLKRRSGRKEIIVPEGLEGASPPIAPAHGPLVTAVARAFAWQEAIESGRYPSATALAEAMGLDRSYVRRILALASLAPDIVEAIVEGREPTGMSLDRLMTDVPMGWEEQRGRFGFLRQ